MIDPQVAFDKLAGFQTAEEIASYFHHEDIHGRVLDSTSCPISTYMKIQTGRMFLVSQRRVSTVGTDPNPIEMVPTETMADFITKFDNYSYPSLINGSNL